ncbi:MAG: hypothetical protein RIS09_1180 [Actinomycetota bacterium]
MPNLWTKGTKWGVRYHRSQSEISSNMSVTRAAIWLLSDLVRVTWAKSGWPLSFSTTATTPS